MSDLQRRIKALEAQASAGADDESVAVEVYRVRSGRMGTVKMTRREYRQGYGDDFILIHEQMDG